MKIALGNFLSAQGFLWSTHSHILRQQGRQDLPWTLQPKLAYLYAYNSGVGRDL